ncbi:hypothetical protein [Streptomyces sp. NBC_01614]|uniref:Uncharacterized protein n=1 Tax=Streptomyces sp. NBC_00180 TaxID=2903632 RepID=A0AAU1HRI6_9ACTN
MPATGVQLRECPGAVAGAGNPRGPVGSVASYGETVLRFVGAGRVSG